MTTTASITHCWTKRRPEPARALAWLRAALLCLLLGWALPAPAQVPGDVVQMQLERSEEGLLLSASLNFELPELVEDALRKGIPMYFTTEVEVLRERWYWSDKTVAQAHRYLRLSYQPLTRRWRLQVASAPFTNAGLGVALAQHFDNYDEALAAMQRIGRWKIAEPSELDSGVGHVVQLRFRVDMSQLPRPLQIGALGPRSGWNLLVARSQRLPAEHPAP